MNVIYRLAAVFTFLVLATACPAVTFPTNITSKTINTSKLNPDFGDFDFIWRGGEDQRVVFTYKTDAGMMDLTGFYAVFKMSLKGGGNSNIVALAVNVGDITISTSQAVFTVDHEDLPTDNTYLAQMNLVDSASPRLASSAEATSPMVSNAV